MAVAAVVVAAFVGLSNEKMCECETEGKKGSDRKLMNDLIKRTLLPLFYASNSIFYRAIIK